MDKQVVLRDLLNAQRALTYNDDAGDYAAANFASQALEKAIKYKLFENGFKYPHTHVITDLLDELAAHNLPFDESIYDIADVVTSWAVRARYSANRAGSRRTIILTLDYAEKLITNVVVPAVSELFAD